MRVLLSAALFLLLVSAVRPVVAADAEDKDPFGAGSVWIGKIRNSEMGPPGDVVLTISERKGETFKGEMSVEREGNLRVHEVSGTAPAKGAGAVIFESEKKGIAQMKVRGKLLNGIAVLQTSGTAPSGRKIGGEMNLRPKLK